MLQALTIHMPSSLFAIGEGFRCNAGDIAHIDLTDARVPGWHVDIAYCGYLLCHVQEVLHKAVGTQKCPGQSRCLDMTLHCAMNRANPALLLRRCPCRELDDTARARGFGCLDEVDFNLLLSLNTAAEQEHRIDTLKRRRQGFGLVHVDDRSFDSSCLRSRGLCRVVIGGRKEGTVVH